MNSLISNHIIQLKQIFKENKIERAYVFGSILNKAQFNDQSDIDILVQFQEDLEPLEQGNLWWSLYDKLKALFQREVDVLTEKSLQNPYLIKEIDNTKQLIYKR